MNKLFKKKYFYIICIGIIVALILFCIPKNESKPLVIKNISPSLLENVTKENENLFVLAGESSSIETKTLLESIKNMENEIDYPIYYLDTLYFTKSLNDKSISETTRNELINKYISFQNKYNINTLPTIIYFEKNKSISSTDDYLNNDYFTETDQDKKNIILKNANNKIISWFQQYN